MRCQVVAASGVFPRLSIPLFLSRVPAGLPAQVQDQVERLLDLNELCVRHPTQTYFARAEGESMTEAGIFHGDLLVVDRSIEPKHGRIVIACIDGQTTCKRLETTPSIRLVPENPHYRAIRVPEWSQLDIFGVVTHVIHSVGV